MFIMTDENKKKQLRRKFISLEEKINILNRIKDGEKVSSIAKSLKLHDNTVRTIKENENKIRKTVTGGFSIGAKRVARVRDINMIRMENALMAWYEDCTHKKIPLTGIAIKYKALKIYKHLKKIEDSPTKQQNESFGASDGWLRNFKKRFLLHDMKLQGEQASADAESAENSLRETVEREEHAAEQICNADKKLPSPTHTMKNEGCAKELTEEELMKVIDQSTTINTSIDDNVGTTNDKSSSNINLNGIKEALDLFKQAELHFLQNDPSTARSGKFIRELRRILLPYQELLAEKEKENDKTSAPTTNLISRNGQDITNNVDEYPKSLKKRKILHITNK